MPWWEIVDATGWEELQPEQRGLRTKQWVRDQDGTVWLRKSIRGWELVPGGSRPTEPAVECFTLELARRCGFEVALGRPAVWDGPTGQVRGLVSRRFHDESEEQRTGAELIEGFDRDSRESRIAATLEVVRGAIARLQAGTGVDLLTPFVRTLLFDAWIGNGDRHVGNWAVLLSATPRFAPMFDTAGCLGTELLRDHPLLVPGCSAQSLLDYARKCKSGFGDGRARPGIFQTEVLAITRTWPEWPAVFPEMFARFIDLLEREVDAMLSEVPDTWWPPACRRFARRMLEARVKLVEGAAP